jgi:hypothetical protein
MRPSDVLLAFRHVFDQNAYDWKELKKTGTQERTYFKKALTTLVTSLRDLFRTNGAEWITDAHFVESQASNLQKLLYGGASGVDWRGAARRLCDADFWRMVRQHGGHVNISLVLYLRKVCLVRDGYGAAVEQFISHLNKIIDDPQRRGLGNEKVEDTLRILFNGPCVEEWDASDAEMNWTQVFKLKPVSSVGQRLSSLDKNGKRNTKRRQRYAASEKYQQKTRKRANDNYEQRRMLVALSRGAQREGHKKRKPGTADLASPLGGKRRRGTDMPKAPKLSPSVAKRKANKNGRPRAQKGQGPTPQTFC